MKKSTTLIIFIIYLVSIVAIGFFGMASKVYDEVKYVQSIDMTVRTDDDEAYRFKENGTTAQGNKRYQLMLYFDKAIDIKVDGENGGTEMRKALHLTFIPNITYDTGGTANAEEESIEYSISNQSYVEKEYVSINKRGELMCFKNNISFKIYVEPESKGSYSAGVVIDVYVRTSN